MYVFDLIFGDVFAVVGLYVVVFNLCYAMLCMLSIVLI
jgi:hypothetical protein